MSNKFPCPNCNNSRESSVSHCKECKYPNHVREKSTGSPDVDCSPRRGGRWQYHLDTLFVCMISVAIFFAGLSWWGVDGLWVRFSIAMRIGVVLSTFIEINYRWRKHDFPSREKQRGVRKNEKVSSTDSIE